MQLRRNLGGYLLDLPDRLDIELLRRELDGCVAGVDARILNVFAYGGHQYAAAVSDCIELYLLATRHELADDHGMLGRDLDSPRQHLQEPVAVMAYAHGRTGKDIGRPHQHGEADFHYEAVDFVQGGEFLPAGLVNAERIHYGRELVPVLRPVDVCGGSAEYVHAAFGELDGEVVGNLSSHGYDHSLRSLQGNDVHYPFERQLVEVEPVAHVVVGGNGLGIVVDHDAPPALPADLLHA